MTARLNMNNISFNHGKLIVCKMCHENLESLEHLFECRKVQNVIDENVSINMLKSKEKNELLQYSNIYQHDIDKK